MKNKTRSEYILDALLTGKSLLAAEITKMVSAALGEEIKIQDIASLMNKLSNPWVYPTGNFIKKNKTLQGFEYSLVPEILKLAPEEVYDLTRNIDKYRFTLEMALEKIPELGRYVKKSDKPGGNKKSAIKEPAKKTATLQVKTSPIKSNSTKENFSIEADLKSTEPVIQAATVENIVSIFLNEIEKIGGLKVNVNLNVRRLKSTRNL